MKSAQALRLLDDWDAPAHLMRHVGLVHEAAGQAWLLERGDERLARSVTPAEKRSP